MAFLGAFAETRGEKAYCDCREFRYAPKHVGPVDNDDAVVATVRLRERPGAAIAVCEFPPALQLATTPREALHGVKERLRDVVVPPRDGSPQFVLVVRESTSEATIEALR